ncbi:MAG: hypothetical protein P8Y71_29890 [Pseudolabrys sp.]
MLGTIVALVALCNLTFRLMDISVFEALAWILAAYQKTFHPPVDYVLSHFSLRLPAAAKDVLVLYVAVGGVLYRTLSHQERSPLKAQFPVTWRTRFWNFRLWGGNVLAAVLWPYSLGSVLRYPCFLVKSSSGYHGRLPPPRGDWPPARREKVMKEMLSYVGKDATIICNERQLMGVYAITLFAAVTCLVILNAALDRLSAAH